MVHKGDKKNISVGLRLGEISRGTGTRFKAEVDENKQPIGKKGKGCQDGHFQEVGVAGEGRVFQRNLIDARHAMSTGEMGGITNISCRKTKDLVLFI